LVVLREDPLGEGGEAVAKAFRKLSFLLTLDWRTTRTAAISHLALPVCAYGEMDGSYLNFEGRIQLVRAGLLPFQESDPAWKPLWR